MQRNVVVFYSPPERWNWNCITGVFELLDFISLRIIMNLPTATARKVLILGNLFERIRHSFVVVLVLVRRTPTLFFISNHRNRIRSFEIVRLENRNSIETSKLSENVKIESCDAKEHSDYSHACGTQNCTTTTTLALVPRALPVETRTDLQRCSRCLVTVKRRHSKPTLFLKSSIQFFQIPVKVRTLSL